MKEIEEIVEQLDLLHIDAVAIRVALGLQENGATAAYMSPGDGTAYQIMIADTHRAVSGSEYAWFGGRFLFSSNHGPQYSWGGQQTEWTYVNSKFVDGDRMWTSVVLTEFLNRLRVSLLTLGVIES